MWRMWTKRTMRQKKTTDWSSDSINDEGFRTRFFTLPAIIKAWVKAHVSLDDARILDFGCGEGISALGLALDHKSRLVVGVDIMPDPERCLHVAQSQIGLATLPDNLALHRVNPGELHSDRDQFDVIYSWSVFEHVDERVIGDVIQLLYKSLAPNGVLLIQIAPLYYSAEGSHLCDYIREPWGHLLHQHNVYYDKLVSATSGESDELTRALWSTYRTLNQITALELERVFENQGFEIVRKYVTQDAHIPPAELLSIFNRDVLTTNQIVLLLRKKIA